MSVTPALDQLMGAYFHQDWRLEAEDEWDVVRLFVADEPDLARLLPAEIDEALARHTSDAELKHFIVDTLGAYYRADRHGGTYRDWLLQVAARVRRAIGPEDAC